MENDTDISKIRYNYTTHSKKRAFVFLWVAGLFIPLSFLYIIASLFYEMSPLQDEIYSYTVKAFFLFLIGWSLYNCISYFKFSKASEKYQESYDEEVLETLKEHDLLFDHKAGRKHVLKYTILSVILNVAFLVFQFFI